MNRPRLPRSVVTALWLNAHAAGEVGPRELADAVLADDPAHLVREDGGVRPLQELLAELASARRRAGVALPVPGAPTGLAGPPAFNTAALEAGEALVVGTLGLVPQLDARTVVWTAYAAAPAPLLDPDEAGRELREVLARSVRTLTELDVAAWRPEIPDALLNLSRRPALALPPGIGSRRTETLERALLCLEIADLARSGEGGAVTAYEMERRRDVLAELDQAARRGVVAVASAPAR